MSGIDLQRPAGRHGPETAWLVSGEQPQGKSNLDLEGRSLRGSRPTSYRGPCKADSVYRDTWSAMGTRFSLEIVAPDRSMAETAFAAAREEVERIEQLLSDYRPSSELSRLNRDRSLTLDPEMFALLVRVGELVEATRGSFDPAVGALVDAWGFSSGRFQVPADSTLERLVEGSGWRHLRLESTDRRATLTHRGVRLDPGAFGKGYAAERVADLLLRLGVTCALVDAGQSTWRALGPPPRADGWAISLPSPDGVHRTVSLVHEALATTGSSARQFEQAGRIYGHVLDPRTGRTAPAGRLVFVRAPSALDADALSTALYVTGPGGAASILGPFPGASALLFDDRVPRPTPVGPWRDSP